MRRGLSSIYGFIVIYLITIAAIDSFSSAIGSLVTMQSAQQSANEIEARRRIEHLSLKISGNTLIISNVGLIPSKVAYLLIYPPLNSSDVPVDRELFTGESLSIELLYGDKFAVITDLGNVFLIEHLSQSSSVANWKDLQGVGGPLIDMQLFQNPSDPSRLYMVEGSKLSTFSTASGQLLWSIDLGDGEITGVMPLSDGYLYVSNAYSNQYTAYLHRLDSNGNILYTYSVRSLRLYTWVEVQFPDNDMPPYPLGSEPVQKGFNSLYAVYDGWFLSSSGLSSITFNGDWQNLIGSDSSHIYIYRVTTDAGGFGCSNPRGNALTLQSYNTDSSGISLAWTNRYYFNVCNLYPQTLVSSASGGSHFAAIFANSFYSPTNYFGGPYSGNNPFLLVVSSSGETRYANYLGRNGYSSIAIDASYVYLALPASSQIERIPINGGASQFYQIGIKPIHLISTQGFLFALSSNRFAVLDSSINTIKAIDLSPNTFYSLSNDRPLEQSMHAPSFLVLNSTHYAALVRNSTGYGELGDRKVCALEAKASQRCYLYISYSSGSQ
jgi:hypothetical protein